ncbi:MAG: hypothetical protein ACOWWM_05865 [Desulfobacterales bacterium]
MTHGLTTFFKGGEPAKRYEASVAQTGEEALSLYQGALAGGRPFDLVIPDLTVKGKMGGKEALRKLKRINPQVRALVSSGYAEDPVIRDHTGHVFCGVVAKSYLLQEVALEPKRVGPDPDLLSER